MRIELVTWFFSIITLTIFCSTSPVHSQCLEDQKYLLLQLKTSLQFDSNSSVKLVNWTQSNDCCQWNGVTCDHFGCVIGLDVSGESIYGGLNDSSSLFRLKFLEELNLAYNSFDTMQIPSFSTNLPESIGNLTELRGIKIRRGHFSGLIPNSLANLRHLVYLDFSSNNFTGPIPSFQRSKNLTHIDLSNNALTGPVPSTYFEGLSNLVYIDLGYNSFHGSIPSTLFSFPSLLNMGMSNNQFSEGSGLVPNVSSSPLIELDLSSNKLQGPIPLYFFDFQNLKYLSLSFNNFSGTIQLESIRRLQNLEVLDLSYNTLSVNASISNSSLSSFPQLGVLGLASCNLKKFPPLMNQLLLYRLDLSNNRIPGVIPDWIWNIGGDRLERLNLSCNLLVGLLPENVIPSRLNVLDLHSNQLSGKIKIPREAWYVDYSRNKFSGEIGNDIGEAYGQFFSLSDNMLSGPIPTSICNNRDFEFLDLSNNRFNGTIPQCLLNTVITVLNLQNNSLTGNIPVTFPEGCNLRTLDLSGNHLEGQVPKSLANCANAEVLNLGSNNINGNFPCFLKNLSSLRVLVLRSNKFQGNIRCLGIQNNIWPKLQIIDLASNNFSGILPPKFFLQRKAMMDPDLNLLQIRYSTMVSYYQASVTVINKGQEMKLVKILTIFTTIDFSNNRFTGDIPESVGDLKSLIVLNLSRNALTGSIPPSLGNLAQLESLDLSWNKLGGSIPVPLAGLTFLSFVNLSYNQLIGMIPRGPQLQLFPATSFEGNKGLWGPPLTTTLGYSDDDEINWVYITTTLGFTVGFGVIVGPLFYSKRWRQYYYRPFDRVIVRILHHQEQRARRQRRRDNINQLRRCQHH